MKKRQVESRSSALECPNSTLTGIGMSLKKLLSNPNQIFLSFNFSEKMLVIFFLLFIRLSDFTINNNYTEKKPN